MSESSPATPSGDPDLSAVDAASASVARPSRGGPAAPEVTDPDALPHAAREGRLRERRPRVRREWTQGGSSVRRWGWELVGWAMLALGLGLLGSTVAGLVVGGEAGDILGTVVLWAAFAVPVVLALARSRPRGLLRFRATDLLYGVVLGGMLRIAQGWLEVAGGGSGAWPSYPSVDGALPATWAFDALSAAVIAPVLEELFFRGLVLVALYTAVRRLAGREVAAFAAVVGSTAVFVIAHAVLAPMGWDAVAALSLVGLTAGVAVLLTGRVWTAVLVHVVYNATWVALATVGTLLAG